MLKQSIVIPESFRGLKYVDGAFEGILGPGHHEFPAGGMSLFGKRRPAVTVTQIDMRERELTIKGQEILTADKVAIRVSIIVQFQVTDPAAAKHRVQNFEERLYSDVQLAARRSLASMTLEEILTNRNRLSEDILRDVKEGAGGYGVAVLRADVKDLVFPGNLQEIMNRVLAAERLAQVQLVEARTKAETQQIDAEVRATAAQREAHTAAAAIRARAEAEADAQRLRAEADAAGLLALQSAAQALAADPALLRLRELDTLAQLATNSAARIYIGFDKHAPVAKTDE